MRQNNILIVSEQSYQKVNRAIYDLLRSNGLNVNVIIPFDAKLKQPQDLKEYYYAHPIKNYHPRRSLIDFNVAKKNINTNYYLIESDFHTLTCLYTIIKKIFRRSKAVIVLSTFENIQKDYLKIALQQLKDKKIKYAAGHFGMYLMEKIFGRYIDHIFTFSNDSKEIHKRKFKQSIVHLIPLGIDQRKFKTVNKAQKKEVTIGFFGRIIPEKNPHLVVDLFETLSTSFPNLRLHMQDPQRFDNFYAKKLSTRLSKLSKTIDRIQVFDPSHDEMPKTLRNIDILIAPSVTNDYYKEQYGRIIVEAKLSGVLVLTSASGAFPEVNGFSDQVFSLEGDSMYTTTKNFIELLVEEPKLFAQRVEASVAHANEFQTVDYQGQQMLNILLH